MKSLAIASWNINSVRLRIELVAKFLKLANPDIMCFQETKCIDANIEYTGGDRGWAGDIPRAMLGIDKMLSTGYDVRYNSEDAIRHTAKCLIKEIGL